MELVIKISEDDFNMFTGENYFSPTITNIKKAILNSKPLPKGHGRIVDESKISKGTWNGKYLECNAPTIIEAERNEEDEDTN